MEQEIKLLHIEDNEDDSLLILRSLRKSGLRFTAQRVDTVQGLEQALALESWDVVLSDYSLPTFDGLAALQIVNRFQELPFILVSGAIGEETAVEIMKAGAKDFIMKDNLGRLGPAVLRELAEVRIHKEKEASEAVIQALMKGLASATGYDAFDNIINGVCEWLGADHGLVGKLESHKNRINTLSFFKERGKSVNFSYDLAGTPCSAVISKGLQVFVEDVRRIFPADSKLQRLQAESYIGIPLKNAAAEVIGILCFMSAGRLKLLDRLEMVMEIVAAKAASELDRLQAEANRLLLEEHLRQAQKMEAIGTMAGGIAHDFNNILTGIIGYSELVLDDLQAAPESQSKILKVLQAGHRAKELVRQILTFSRHSSDQKFALEMVKVVQEAMKLLRASLPSTIEIVEKMAKSSGMVLAVPSQLHQIVMNLCTNAYHAMAEKGGTLTVTVEARTLCELEAVKYELKTGEYVCLRIADTGHGISEYIIEHIFEPYFTTKAKGVGTGLGLSLVHGIVKGHDGGIAVESVIGKGTVFSVFLPQLQGDAQSEQETMPAGGGQSGGTESILVADDEEIIVQFCQDVLQKAGYKVTVGRNGQEALQAFLANPAGFDLLLTDLTMPKMIGTQLVQEVKKLRPQLPCILCTGYNETISKEEAMALGVSEYLMKPVPAVELCRTIRLLLDKFAKR